MTPLKLVAIVIAGIIGWAVGGYAPAQLLIPSALAMLVGWIASRSLKEESGAVLPAFAVQAGLGLWCACELVYRAFHGLWDSVASGAVLNSVVLFAGLTWLIMRRSVAPMILLSGLQLVGLIGNGIQFGSASYGTSTHKTLSVYLLFRIAALGFLLKAMRDHRKREASQNSVPSGPTDPEVEHGHPSSIGDQPKT